MEARMEKAKGCVQKGVSVGTGGSQRAGNVGQYNGRSRMKKVLTTCDHMCL